jgi:hypothetical protein
MRGFPLLNLLFMAACLALLVIPLSRINHPAFNRMPVEKASPENQDAGSPVHVVLRFVHAPQTVTLIREGKALLLQGSGLERTVDGVWPLQDDALEFAVTAAWEPGAAPGMVEMKVAPDGRAEQLQNIWSDETGAPVEEVVRFTWRKKS